MPHANTVRRASIIASICVLLTGSTAVIASTQTSAFTYQGVLKNAGAPLNGTIDLQFKLFDAPAAGAQVGATIPINGVSVVDGLVAQTLDFGALALNGEERWLEIAVASPAGGGVGPFTPLAPRQKLASAPYAAFALQTALSGTYGNAVSLTNPANTFTGAFTGSGAGLTNLSAAALTGTINSANIGGTYSNAVTFSNAGNSFTGSHSGDGSGLTGLNASNISTGTLSLARLPTSGTWSLSNLTLQRSLASNLNPTLTLQQTGAGSASTIRYLNSVGNQFNVGMTGAGEFGVGYNANPGLVGDLLRMTPTGNTGLGTISPLNRLDVEGGAAIGAAYSGTNAAPANGLIVEGSVGIGTASPVDKLHVVHSTDAIRGETSGTTSRAVYGLNTAATGQNYGVYGGSASTTGRGVFGEATATTGATFGGKFENSSTTGVGAAGLASATTGINFGLVGQSSSTSGRGVYGLINAATGTSYAIYGENPTTAGRGVYAITTAATGTSSGPFAGRFDNEATGGAGVVAFCLASSGVSWAVSGTNSSTSGMGVFGRASATTGETYGVFGRTDSATGYGVFGSSTALTGINYAGYFESASPDTRAVYGEALSTTGLTYGGRFVSNSPDGRGVTGRNLATTGNAYGVQGQSDSTSGAGVFGITSAATGNGDGVYGESASTTGRGVHGYSADNIGVYGQATATSGLNYGVVGDTFSTSGRGVYGRTNTTTGTVYGVYGENDNGAGGYAVFADGDLGTNAFKTFRIDHPADPANKYLIHYSAESDEVINFYSGKVTLNAAGEAVIDLPSYFSLVNKDPRYTLTAVGAPMPNLHVAIEIDETALALGEAVQPGQPAPPCWFKVAGGAPGMKVSWEVKAQRNDRYARAHPALVEAEKQGIERGTYQQPELYGLQDSVDPGVAPVPGTKRGGAEPLAAEPVRPQPAQEGPDVLEPR